MVEKCLFPVAGYGTHFLNETSAGKGGEIHQGADVLAGIGP